MSTLSNKVQLIGNLGQDPEMKTLSNGNTMAKFSIATSERYTNKQGEQVTDTQWHRVVAYNGAATIIEKYVKKGNRIGIEGKLVTRQWDDIEGQKRYTTEVVCNEVLLLGNKS
ncbi:single-stranded DNA-binding protein [Nonlabens xiamenensis]|uniref:single-stranded DNA-binding protein n=1 Tax=Nonlabens xiamenensis TaxID=2341043 RepID=UPI000F60A33E|nr:single-stranded DNA-binding protein [Nonlabens xiamenensis]